MTSTWNYSPAQKYPPPLEHQVIDTVEKSGYTISDNGRSTSTLSAAKRLARYAVTASYLRPGQLRHRVKAVMQRRFLHPTATYRRMYSRRARRADEINRIVFPEVYRPPIDIQEIGEGTFNFLNRKVNLGAPVDWFPEIEVRLWLYNLHYWHYATTLGCEFASNGCDQSMKSFGGLFANGSRLVRSQPPLGVGCVSHVTTNGELVPRLLAVRSATG